MTLTPPNAPFPYLYCEILWVDAQSHAEWVSLDTEDFTPARCVTRGWVVHEDALAITLAATLSEHERTASEIITIPLGCILTRTPL